MTERENIFDYEAIKHFYKDVLFSMLPNAKHKSIGYIGPAEAKRASNMSIDLADTNEINADSKYYYTKKYSFIHYTSIPILLNIIKERKIRLYNLQGMDDKEEFEVSLNSFSKKISAYQIQEIKKKLFCFSMCEVDLEKKEESLPLWRNYGQDGNGVGIVFSFNKRFAKDWVHFMLSQVYYNPKYLENFAKIETLYNNFKSKHNLTINNFDEMFYRYFAFHKSKIYSTEREVRLIYCQGFRSYEEPQVKLDINRRNEKTSYIELDIEWEWDKKTKDFIIEQGITPKNIRPKITIDEIILGYRLSNKAKYDISEVCSKHSNNLKKRPEISNSSLFEHFKNK